MQIVNNISEIQEWCREKKLEGKKIGLVPTMGYLHEGHLSLVREARRDCDIVVVSIFVNPAQFGAGEDYEVYPRNMERDCALLEREMVDLVFAPEVKEMYPAGYQTYVEVFGQISNKMCGASRPGHFRGVCTVVSKLFNICQPDIAYFGQKDAQQVMVLEKMVRELNFPLKIVRVPIVREEDGLAMSSRNVYLDQQQRQEALVLYKALKSAEENITQGERDTRKIKDSIEKMIKGCPQADVDYIEISDAADLADIDEIRGQVLIALAVRFGNTRLIDNLIVEV
jgi:pantoate--beta-alanine ligase